MARKDARLMMQEAEHADRTLSFIPAVAKEMDRWIEKGHGQDDWTIIAKDNIWFALTLFGVEIAAINSETLKSLNMFCADKYTRFIFSF